MEYDNNNTGVLFRNETATPENKQPYMTGKINVEGKELQLAGWMKESTKTGKKFLSLKVQEPRVQDSSVSDNVSSTGDMPL